MRQQKSQRDRIRTSLAGVASRAALQLATGGSPLRTSPTPPPPPPASSAMDDASSSVLSFVKKIVNKGGPEPSSSYSATAARYRSGGASGSSSSSSTSRATSYRASISGASRRYSTQVGTTGGSSSKGSSTDASQALLNINKLKEKVASHGSRVMASFKVDGSGGGSGQQQPPQQQPATSSAKQQQQMPSSSTSGSAAASSSSTSAQASSTQQQQQHPALTDKSASISKLNSQSSLTNEQLTAHLTQEERVILEKVFLKEEEFHRKEREESVLKSSTLTLNKQLRRLSSRCLAADIRDVISPESPCSSSSPPCPAVSPPLLGFCRICRKNIEEGEKHYFCDTCSQPVCEDCSSYSKKNEGQVWSCSYCRRRGTQPAVVALDADLGLAFQKRRVSALANRTGDSGAGRGSGRSLESNISPPPTASSVPSGSAVSLFKRRTSISDSQRQGSLEVASIHSDERRASERFSVDYRRSSSRPGSPERYGSSASNRTCDSATSGGTASNKYPSTETLSDQRSSSEPHGLIMHTSVPHGGAESVGGGGYHYHHHQPHRASSREDYEAGMLPLRIGQNTQQEQTQHAHNLPRRSFTASDSSLEEVLGGEDGDEEQDLRNNGSASLHQKRRRSRRSKILRQKRSLTNEDALLVDNVMYYQHAQTDEDISPHHRNNAKGVLRLPLAGGANQSSQLRHIASEATLYLDSGASGQIRRQSDSQSSDFSDNYRLASPPPESMSPSSPDFSRSPRQSADSDMLDLPSIGQLPSQRRSIPAVLVDEAVDPNRLTLKDCYPRRSSTGRALPKIPVEQSRSLLDLPAKTHSSTHSLDLPHDQPRRASAPEGENIRIVIDDVDSTGFRNKNSRIERVILHRDENDRNVRTRGFGLCAMGGKLNEQDGKLYAYVSWTVHGGPADKMGLKPGDKVLEWDGKSLVNLSYEQVCSVIDCSAKTAELIIEPLNREERKGFLFHQKRRMSQVSTQQSFDFSVPAVASTMLPGSSPGSIRRRLPKIPDLANLAPAPPSQGAILCHISMDVERSELLVVLHCAKSLTGASGPFPCFAQVQILPSLGFTACKTELSATLEWNETLIFQAFPVEKAIDMAVEVGIWEDTGSEMRSLGDTVIPLANAVAHQTDWWPLLSPNYQVNRSYSTDFSNAPTLLLLPQEDNQSIHLNEHSRSVPGSRRNSGRLDNVQAFQSGVPRTRNSLESSPTRTQSLRLGRHSAIDPPGLPNEVMGGGGGLGVGLGAGLAAGLAAGLCAPSSGQGRLLLDTIGIPGADDASKLRRKSSSALGTSKMSRTFSLKGGGGGSQGLVAVHHQGDQHGQQQQHHHHHVTREDMGNSSSDEAVSDSDSVSTLAGDQFADQGYNDCSVVGELKLGLIMTKGLLEIEVICAKGLPLNSAGQPPDTYVKTYMKEPRKQRLHKQKTSVVCSSTAPQYRQTITYDAQMVCGKKLLVMVWEKKQRFDHNNLVGGVDIEVNKLQLHKLTIGWYKLFRAAKYNP